MTQIMIGDHARHHRLADRHGADADAGIVAALGDDLGLVAVAVDGLARGQDRGGRLHGEARDDRLAGRDAAEDAAGMVRQEERLAVIAHAHLVGVLLAGDRGGRKAVADLDALHGVDAHQRGGDVRVELAVDRRAEARRHALGDDLDHGADRGAALADAVEIIARTAADAARRDRRTDFRRPASQSQRARSILCGPICTSAPRTVMPGTTLRAIAPAATRAAVSRADERPPPR